MNELCPILLKGLLEAWRRHFLGEAAPFGTLTPPSWSRNTSIGGARKSWRTPKPRGHLAQLGGPPRRCPACRVVAGAPAPCRTSGRCLASRTPHQGTWGRKRPRPRLASPWPALRAGRLGRWGWMAAAGHGADSDPVGKTLQAHHAACSSAVLACAARRLCPISPKACLKRGGPGTVEFAQL